MRKRSVVVLSEQERARLHTMIGRGVAPASALTHARILLKATRARPDPAGPTPPSGPPGGQPGHRGPGPHAPCRGRAGGGGVPHANPPPAGRGAGGPPGRADLQRPTRGHKRWTLRLLADRLVELQVVNSVS